MRSFADKPWWEKVADFNDADQQEFLRGVFVNRITSRPRQYNAYLLGLSQGYLNRKFAAPDSHKGKKLNG